MNFFKALFGGRKSHAEENHEDEKKKGAKDFDVLKYDGVRALRQHQADYAVQCLTHALDIDGADLECRDYLSQAYMALGDLPNAYEQLRLMSEARPDNVAVFLRMAEVAYMMENYTAMADATEKALLLDDSNAQTYYMYAKACRAQGDLTNAVAMLTKALMLRNDFDEARLLRGTALLENGELDEAAEDADSLCSRIADNEDVLLLKSRVLEQQGKHVEAEQMYGKVIAVNPFCIEAFAERAAVRRDMGDEQGAVEDEATADEMRAESPVPADEGIEKKTKDKMRQLDPYHIFNNE